MQPPHFKGKDAITHVAEAQAAGIIASTEIHGTEIAGNLSSATDASRETALLLLILFLFYQFFDIQGGSFTTIMIVFGAGWLLWKSGRSAWLGWSRLERLHRILEQEKYEIDHNREQEREELTALYAAKGFQGKLLEDVIDVLMADGDRLLRVMVEEELGLSLQSQEHPLKQGLGAAIGVLGAWALCLIGYLLFPTWGLLAASMMIAAIAAGYYAKLTQNKIIDAVVWNVGLFCLSAGTIYFLLVYVFQEQAA